MKNFPFVQSDSVQQLPLTRLDKNSQKRKNKPEKLEILTGILSESFESR